MAVKSGLSHTLSALLAMIVGAIFTEYLKMWVPGVMKILNQAAMEASKLIQRFFHISISENIFVPILIGGALAFLWGVIYHLSRFK